MEQGHVGSERETEILNAMTALSDKGDYDRAIQLGTAALNAREVFRRDVLMSRTFDGVQVHDWSDAFVLMKLASAYDDRSRSGRSWDDFAQALHHFNLGIQRTRSKELLALLLHDRALCLGGRGMIREASQDLQLAIKLCNRFPSVSRTYAERRQSLRALESEDIYYVAVTGSSRMARVHRVSACPLDALWPRKSYDEVVERLRATDGA